METKRQLKVALEKLLFAKNKDLAMFYKTQQTNDLLASIMNESKKDKELSFKGAAQIKGDPGDKPVKGQDYWTEEEIAQFKADVTPVIGQDYFTDEQLAEVINLCTPEKGKDYFTEEEIKAVIKEVVKLVPRPKDGKSGERGATGPAGSPDTPIQIATKLNTLTKVINARVIDGLLTPDEIIAELKNPKSKSRLKLRDIEGMPLNFNDMRWHGGGPKITLNGAELSSNGFSNINLIAGTGITITTTQDIPNSRTNVTISASSSGVNIATEQLEGSSAAGGASIDLAQLSEHYDTVLLVTRNGQIITPVSGWTQAGDIITIIGADKTDDFLVQYTYA